MIRRIRACCDPNSPPERPGLGFSVAAEHAVANRSVRDWRHLRPLAAAVLLRLTDTARLGDSQVGKDSGQKLTDLSAHQVFTVATV
jgi:hypothetical protein